MGKNKIYEEKSDFEEWFIDLRSNINHLFRRLKWTYQRAFRGYDDKYWDLSYSLARQIAAQCRVLQKNMHGCHPDLFDDAAPEGKQCHRMEEMLEEMCSGFEGYVNAEEGCGLPTEEDYKKLDRSLELFRIHFTHLWD